MPRAHRAPTTSCGSARSRPGRPSRSTSTTWGPGSRRGGRRTSPGSCGPCGRGAATTCAGSTSPSTARCRSGAGLSSSAALECAVGAAASDLFGLDLLGDEAARAAARAGLRPRRERRRGRTDRRHGPVGRAALPRRSRPAARLPQRSDRARAVRPRRAGHGTGTSCSSPTPGRRTPSTTGSTRQRRSACRAGRRRAGGRVAARRRPGRARRRPGPPVRRRPAPPRAPRRHRDRAGARGRRRPAGAATWPRSGGSSTPRTPRCATTTR